MNVPESSAVSKVMPLSTDEIRVLARSWIDAWNARSLDRIMEHYAEDVEFEANTVARRWQKADGKLHGVSALREHFRVGLELAPQLHFKLDTLFFAPSGYAILYHRENGNCVLDVVELDERGKAKRVKAFYSAEQK